MREAPIVNLPVPFFDWGDGHGGMDRDPYDGDWFKKSEVLEALEAAGDTGDQWIQAGFHGLPFQSGGYDIAAFDAFRAQG